MDILLSALALGVTPMIGWIGFSAYSKIAQKDASTVQETVMDTSAVDNYVSGLSAASSDAE